MPLAEFRSGVVSYKGMRDLKRLKSLHKDAWHIYGKEPISPHMLWRVWIQSGVLCFGQDCTSLWIYSSVLGGSLLFCRWICVSCSKVPSGTLCIITIQCFNDYASVSKSSGLQASFRPIWNVGNKKSNLAKFAIDNHLSCKTRGALWRQDGPYSP